jgi:hypothetical protein
MEKNLTQLLENGKFTVLSREQQAKVLGGESKDLTPKQICEADHVGYCGACDKDGSWVPCG